MSPLPSVDEVAGALLADGGELRAGGTDVVARHRIGRAAGPFVDLLGVAALHGIAWRTDGSARIGALTTLAEVAADERLGAAYPALAASAAPIATPQIRGVATVGGNLLQRNRCWYFRNPAFSCHQTGGDGCPARKGAHLYSAVIDQGPCVAPHPSTLAPALLLYDAVADVHGRDDMAVADLYGDGSDPTRDHLLADGEVLLGIDLPVPAVDERAAYHRTTARDAAEWPLVEAVARVVLNGTTITEVAVAAGGVARMPLRLGEVETALAGIEATPEVLRAAAALAKAGCSPLPQNAYKVGMLEDIVLEVLERTVGTSQ